MSAGIVRETDEEEGDQQQDAEVPTDSKGNKSIVSAHENTAKNSIAASFDEENSGSDD